MHKRLLGLLITCSCFSAAHAQNSANEPDESGLGGTGRVPMANIPDMEIPTTPDIPDSLFIPEEISNMIPDLPASSAMPEDLGTGGGPGVSLPAPPQ